MTQQTKVTFTVPTTNTDGSPITEALSYTVFIDTANPPVKAYSVPAANIAAAVAGLVTVTFAQLGFTPVPGADYYADVSAADADGVSPLSNVFAFKYEVVPNAPTGFTVG
jgi:hypothetical protein